MSHYLPWARGSHAADATIVSRFFTLGGQSHNQEATISSLNLKLRILLYYIIRYVIYIHIYIWAAACQQLHEANCGKPAHHKRRQTDEPKLLS